MNAFKVTIIAAVILMAVVLYVRFDHYKEISFGMGGTVQSSVNTMPEASWGSSVPKTVDGKNAGQIANDFEGFITSK